MSFSAMRFVFFAVAVQLSFCGLVIGASVAPEQVLAGEDADHDGIRDDVQVWVDQRFSGQERMAARQFASAMQSIMVIGDAEQDDPSLDKGRQQLKSAIECVLATTGEISQEAIFDGLYSTIVNSTERESFMEKLERQFPEEDVLPSAVQCNWRSP